ncbi:hypothetical protein VTN77DRAFT_3632 [Rasamsonia byssochlamydoides]|uniref:uncharacterized protein n=1 Tax=Rasamsonia byssochlamydoides TaxID=89139 RepID=UPI0037434E99
MVIWGWHDNFRKGIDLDDHETDCVWQEVFRLARGNSQTPRCSHAAKSATPSPSRIPHPIQERRPRSQSSVQMNCPIRSYNHCSRLHSPSKTPSSSPCPGCSPALSQRHPPPETPIPSRQFPKSVSSYRTYASILALSGIVSPPYTLKPNQYLVRLSGRHETQIPQMLQVLAARFIFQKPQRVPFYRSKTSANVFTTNRHPFRLNQLIFCRNQ